MSDLPDSARRWSMFAVVVTPAGPAPSDHRRAAGAFKDRDTKGVCVRINSPGGSPVQAGLSTTKSGGCARSTDTSSACGGRGDGGVVLHVAAADRIYVDRAAGGIDRRAIYHGFGVADALDKVGVESRTVTAGTNKAFIDPFSPVDRSRRHICRRCSTRFTWQFIGAVREGRGKRLKETPEMSRPGSGTGPRRSSSGWPTRWATSARRRARRHRRRGDRRLHDEGRSPSASPASWGPCSPAKWRQGCGLPVCAEPPRRHGRCRGHSGPGAVATAAATAVAVAARSNAR